jgi:surfeit locus 1 family protein
VCRVTRRQSLAFGWVLALLAMAGFARLGFWQYGRMHEKQAMLARAADVLRDRKPHPLDTVDANPDPLTSLHWVEGDGQVLAPTLLLDNQLREGRAGVRMYCVLQPASGPARLVDFGWLPVPADRRIPDVACKPGPLHVRGLSAPPPSSGFPVGAALQSDGPSRWLMTRVDFDAIDAALHAHLATHVVRLDPALPIGYARDLDILPNTLPPERHLGYAVQWWALSVAVFATALLLTFKKKKRRA